MKLELKHLAPYLPYGLKCYEPRFNTKHTIIGFVGNEVYIGDEDEISSFVLDDETLPILRPLSDLTKEIEVNGKKIIPCNLIFPCDYLDNEFDIFSYQYAEALQKEKLNCCLDYNQWNLLFEWHFDVFGLIEKGLAIDINTLPQSSE